MLKQLNTLLILSVLLGSCGAVVKSPGLVVLPLGAVATVKMSAQLNLTRATIHSSIVNVVPGNNPAFNRHDGFVFGSLPPPTGAGLTLILTTQF